MPAARHAATAIAIVLFSFCISHASGPAAPVCEMVSPRQLKALYPAPLYPAAHANGCRWNDRPDGKAYFQIGVIESAKSLRQFFEKTLPADYQLRRINDLGDRGLFTESGGYLSVVAIREGGWVLISTVDLLYIKEGDPRQRLLWDIYRGVLKHLQ